MGLIPKNKTVNRVVLLDIASISPNPYQPRRQFDQKAMQELAESIVQNGLLQPITVRVKEDKYELIAGERRLKACQMLSMKKIPAIVEQIDDKKSAIFALIENLQRKDLNYFEQAQGIARLMQQEHLTQEQVAVQLGKAQSTIANKLRLLQFSDAMQLKILENGLTERHARALLKLPNEQTMEFVLTQIVKEHMNVGVTERFIESLLVPLEEEKKVQPTRLFVVKDVRIFMNTITKAVSTMKMAGIDINTQKVEDEEYIQFTMKIPKKGVYRPHSA